MYRSIIVLIIGLLLGLIDPAPSFAIPTQYGDTGLFSQPTADTLNSGNICLGLWTNSAANPDGNATIVPVTMTLGLGSFIEAYGSYPNLLFNGDEPQSGRGFANIGFKVRLIGKRAAPFKVALDGQFRRSIADDPAFDGLTDKVGRVVVSFKPGKFGLHLSGGYSDNEAPVGSTYENQTLFGGGVEFSPTTRLRLIGEYETASEKELGTSGPAEATLGFQYFFSPHLTINVGVGAGFSDGSPDWRTLIGFSSCQGVGTYIKPVPRAVMPIDESQVKTAEKVKVIKVRTLTPLVPKAVVPPAAVPAVPAVPAVEPVNKYEVPVTPNAEEVTINPSERLAMPVSGLPAALPVASVAAAVKTGRTFQLFDVLATDDGAVIGRKVVDDPRYQANFVSIKEYPEYVQVVFFHRYSSDLPVWIEGGAKYTLSTTLAHSLEDVELKVFRVDGKIPPFNLHIGEQSEVFSFEIAAGAAPEKGSQPASATVAPATAAPVVKGPSTLVKIAKGIALAPVAIVAAPFVGVHYLFTKAFGAPAAVVAPVAAGVALNQDQTATTAPAEQAQGMAPVATAAAPVAVTPESTPAPAVAVAIPAATTIAPTPASAASVAQPQTVAGVAAPTTAAAPAVPAGGPLVTAAPAPSATPLAPTQTSPTTAPAAGSTLAAPVMATAAVSAPVGAGTVAQPQPLPASGAVPLLAVIAGSTQPLQSLQPARPAPANLAFDKPIVAVVYRKFRLPSFTFGFDEWTLSEEGKRALSEVAEELRKEKRWFFVRIDGYTDNLGSSEYNYNLGLRRSISAASYFVANAGLDPALLFVKSVGELEPVAANDSEIGRMQNRRIELLILVPKEEK